MCNALGGKTAILDYSKVKQTDWWWGVRRSHQVVSWRTAPLMFQSLSQGKAGLSRANIGNNGTRSRRFYLVILLHGAPLALGIHEGIKNKIFFIGLGNQDTNQFKHQHGLGMCKNNLVVNDAHFSLNCLFFA